MINNLQHFRNKKNIFFVKKVLFNPLMYDVPKWSDTL